MVKGDLTKIPPEQIEASYNSYFKRLWNNNEAYLREKGFEENYRVYELILGSAHSGT
tara:strand:+ start:3938 stop:4108 length:171 start_codon:yes stop_codon:yes gene_type:complete